MITAYFSLLEHLFVFALAVSDFDPVQDSLKDFIGLRLLEKYKRLFDVTQDRTARTYYNRLHDAAEKWRNPYDHGGFDKRGGALSINVPGLGAIPLCCRISAATRHSISCLSVGPASMRSLFFSTR